MATEDDRIFVSIGVSKPGGGLDQLPGAITASTRMAAWAEAHGYITLLIQDSDLPEITTDLLRDKIVAAIEEVTDRTELKRLVIFFAGHGAALSIGDQYWILTNWHRRPTEAVKVTSLQRMLEFYGPQQVSIIGDACQEFASSFIDLVGSPVLDRPNEGRRRIELDRFFAVSIGKQAFMIKAKGEEKDFCLFTEVLLDALEGDTHESGFEVIDGDRVVTSQSLTEHLSKNVPREAGKHGLQMEPQLEPGFYTDRIYITLPNSSTPGSRESKIIGADSQDTGPNTRAPIPRVTSPSRRIHGTGSFSRMEKQSLQTEVPMEKEQFVYMRRAKENSFADEVDAAVARRYFMTGCGICISGADVGEVEASFGELTRVHSQPDWFRVDLVSADPGILGWSDTLVRLADDRTVPVCSIQGFVAALNIIDDTSFSLIHRRLDSDRYEVNNAIQLLARMQYGLLSRNEIIDTAMELRYGKHKIITLGCVAAQFYDAIRDVDSLRSIAAYYAMNKQPVPLDIVLYGGGTISDHEGRLYADIPAVDARKPRTARERGQSFTYEATPGFKQHPIAGRVPWMRQAWSAIATASYKKSASEWQVRAQAVIEHLAPGMFTIVRPNGHDALVALAGILVKGEPEPELATY